MTATAPARRRLLRIRHDTVETIFGYAYAILMVDVLLVASNLPLAIMLFVTVDSLQYWPFFLVLSLTLAPSVAGAFEVFRAMRDEGRPRPFAAFLHGYRRRGAAAFVVGLASAVVVALALFDGTALAGTVWAPLLGPLLAVLGVGSIAVELYALAGLVVFPSVSVRAIAKASLYLAVRRWYFSVVGLVMVGLIGAAVLLQPVLGAVLVPGILLYAVFANAQYAFQRAVEAERD
ncbi:hypothetical protein [Humibacter sp.]|jgi:hypothetical protein|uniref:hypothetical protein n=1 Tax=Humibacter sp. TaxID=1940291 RepID=UPI002CEF43E2|nr:hypothetical protein [Humibacter sp.]HVX08833.1 hypothetical protein [Humibacter sp.]